MNSKSQRTKRRDMALSSLNMAIEALNMAKDMLSTTPAEAALGSVTVILTMIRDSMANKEDCVNLGLACADVCKALDRGMDGRRMDELSQPVFGAIEQLTTTVAEIQKKIVKWGKRNAISRLFHTKADQKAIAAWRLELNRILHIFNTELAVNTNVVVSDIRHDVTNTHTVVSRIRRDVVNTQTIVSNVHQGVVNTHTVVSELQNSVANTHTIVSDIHRTIVGGREGTDGENQSIQTSLIGESPPPPPRICFGRGELIAKIIGLAESFTPIALIGPGGIGKTSIALTVLHHDRIKEQFGDDRRFIRCDQFPTSPAHFLSRLSKVIGAGVENPGDLTPLRPLLSSRKMILLLDNAESVLDSQGTDTQEIYAMVEELSRFSNICLCITSRISTVPPDCKRLDIPALSMGAACNTFYHIYDSDKRTNLVDNILQQLDFHPLSIALLATVAHHNKWGTGRLTREWERRRTNILHTQHNRSLAATIELSLASPMFQQLGPDARYLLGVVAFYPQGVDENNLDKLFPNITNRTNVFDTFCILSLTHQSNGFITMLAPLRDHLCPQNPTLSPHLCTTKDYYFQRLSVDVYPDKSGYEEGRWITSEDANVEHLLNVFTSIDANVVDVWTACCNFMDHLYQHKPRSVMLGPKIEGLPDNHPLKPQCLSALSRLFYSVGNYAEEKRLLIHALKIWREQENEPQVAHTLVFLAESNKLLGFHEEVIQQGEEALEIYKRLKDTSGQAHSLCGLAWLLQADDQLDAAEEAASRAIDLSDKGDQFRVCQSHRILGNIYCAKGEVEKAMNHLETALRIASDFSWHGQLFQIHHSLARALFGGKRFDDAHAHVEHAKSHAINTPFNLGRTMHLQAHFWHIQHRLQEAKSEALHAAEIYEVLGTTDDLDDCRDLLRTIEREMEELAVSCESSELEEDFRDLRAIEGEFEGLDTLSESGELGYLPNIYTELYFGGAARGTRSSVRSYYNWM